MPDLPDKPLSIGFTLSSEEQPPWRLVELAGQAEQEGFDFVSISDHLHPWVEAQGHSPFVWSVLGAVAARTERISVGVGVTCPIERFPPLLAAHASATTACLLPDRFVFGVGSGEALNEHVTGAAWPAVDIRHEMLAEAIEIIRLLWSGDEITYRGRHYRVEAARLYDIPDRPPPLIVSAFGPLAAERVGVLGDGLWTGTDRELITTWREKGGDGPVYSQLSVCVADSVEEARSTAHHYWPNTVVPGQLSQDLPTTRHFDMASSLVTEDQVAGSVMCGPDPEPIVDAVRAAAEAGIDHVYFHQIGPDQEAFFRLWRNQLGPALQPWRTVDAGSRTSSPTGV